MKVLTFYAKFHPQNEHFVDIFVCPTQKAMHADMRADRTRRGLRVDKLDGVEAAFHPAARTVDPYASLGRIYFYRSGLTVDTVIHECVHAATHRARVLGVAENATPFEEVVAESAANLSEAILGWATKLGVRIKFDLVHDHKIMLVIQAERKK